MVSKKKNSVSLIPYLMPAGIPYLIPDSADFRLKLSASQKDALKHESVLTTFQVVSESNPFSKIIQAEIILDTSGQPESVFLLTQKNIYTLPDAIEALSNVEVEESWQQAFLYYSHNRLSNPPLILDDQIDNNGALVPFQPLWYCRKKQVYFHPLCPDCGAPLDQCYDDDLLIKHGLKPFSKSIQRYLYCLHCIESTAENAVFYVPELDPTIDPKLEKDAPAVLKGPENLIIGMGKLTVKEYPGSDFPCAACDHHPLCYGEEKMAVSRMAVFSFFPFYMMIFKTFASNAVDLFSMISHPVVAEKVIPEADNALKDKASLESSVAKKAIQSILKNILQTWQKEVAVLPVQNQQSRAILPGKENDDRTRVSDREPLEEGNLDRTIIISSREDITKRMAAFSQKRDLEKTVVISKKDKKVPEDSDAANKVKRQTEKTVIITADTMDKYSSSFVGHEQNNGQANNDQTMEKTVIINPKANGAEDKTEIIRNDRQDRYNNDDLDKTVIISPDKVAFGNKHVSDNKAALGNFSSSSDRTIIFADDLEDAAHLTKNPAFKKEPPRKTPPEKLPPKKLTPKKLTPKKLTPKKLTPKKLTPDDALEKTVIINPNKK